MCENAISGCEERMCCHSWKYEGQHCRSCCWHSFHCHCSRLKLLLRYFSRTCVYGLHTQERRKPQRAWGQRHTWVQCYHSRGAEKTIAPLNLWLSENCRKIFVYLVLKETIMGKFSGKIIWSLVIIPVGNVCRNSIGNLQCLSKKSQLSASPTFLPTTPLLENLQTTEVF